MAKTLLGGILAATLSVRVYTVLSLLHGIRRSGLELSWLLLGLVLRLANDLDQKRSAGVGTVLRPRMSKADTS